MVGADCLSYPDRQKYAARTARNCGGDLPGLKCILPTKSRSMCKRQGSLRRLWRKSQIQRRHASQFCKGLLSRRIRRDRIQICSRKALSDRTCVSQACTCRTGTRQTGGSQDAQTRRPGLQRSLVQASTGRLLTLDKSFRPTMSETPLSFQNSFQRLTGVCVG